MRTKKCYILFTLTLLHIASCQSVENTAVNRPKKSTNFNCTGSDFITKFSNATANLGKKPPRDAHVTLRLYTTNSARDAFHPPFKINEGDSVVDMELSGFDPETRTVVIVHGYRGRGESKWLLRMKDAYLTLEHVNAIIVEWEIFAKRYNYYQVASNSLIVADQTAALLHKIRETYQASNWGPLYLIGYSVGAHVAGLIADNLKYVNCSWRVERITGLDPAYPCFNNNSLALSKSDAPYVDVIHTSGSSGSSSAFGILRPIGHVDIYVNGGRHQPSCIAKRSWWNPVKKYKEIKCSHRLSHEYFTESLEVAAGMIQNGRHIEATKWDETYENAKVIVRSGNCKTECKLLGIYSDKTGQDGVYLAVAASRPPFYDISTKDQEAVLKELRRVFHIRS